MSDDGVGIPAGHSAGRPGSMGVTLMRGYVEHQLGGVMRLENRGAPSSPCSSPAPGLSCRLLHGPWRGLRQGGDRNAKRPASFPGILAKAPGMAHKRHGWVFLSGQGVWRCSSPDWTVVR
jgi:hypothetical protein